MPGRQQSPKPWCPPQGWARASCRRRRRRPRKCCLSSTSQRSSMSWRRPSSAGLNDVLLITGRSKRSIEDHFDRAYELEEALTAKEDWDKLALVRESSDLATMHYVRQGDPRGLGHAVLCAAQHVGHEPFAVLLGDDLIDPQDPLLTRMIDVRNQLRRQRRGADGGRPRAGLAVRLRGDRADRRKTTWSRSPTWWRSRSPGRRAEPVDRDRAVRVRPVGLRRPAARRRRAAAARSSSPTRSRCWPATGQGRAARRAVPRAPLRHRQQAGLPADAW